MINQTNSYKHQVKRCAVCKIDLKGRFVYIDEETEQLLGYTMEELFGRPFIEFLVDEDHEIIDRIVDKRNNYESFFDSARVRIVKRDGQFIPATVIMSLNFIAGNPVNFQIIIDTESTPETSECLNSEERSYQDFVDSLLGLQSPLDWSAFSPVVTSFTGAIHLLAYRIDGDELESIGEQEEQSLCNLPDIGSLHRRIAREGGEYGFTSDQDVQRAVENDGVAPSEFVVRLDLGDNGQYMLRFVFEGDLDGRSAMQATSRARLAVGLLQRLFSKDTAEPASTAIYPDATPVIELLSRLGIGLLQIGADGRIAAYNSAFSSHYAHERLEGHYEGLIGLLADRNPPETVKEILAYLETSREKGSAGKFQLTITLPSGIFASLVIFTQSSSPDDYTAWLVLIPVRSTVTTDNDPYPEQSALRSIIGELQSSLSAAVAVSEKLEHEHCGELGENGRLHLQCLSNHLSKLIHMQAELSQLVDVVGEAEVDEPTDLDLLVKRLIHETGAAYPSVRVTGEIGELPRILTCRNKITVILRNILSNCVRFARDEVRLQVAASVNDDLCHIVISDNGPGIPQRHLDHVFDFFCPIQIQDQQQLTGSGGSLALTRQLVRSMGGEIEFVSEEGKGTTVTVIIPVGQIKMEKQ